MPPSVVVDHLRKLPGFEVCVFDWDGGGRQLYDQFNAIQVAAGVHLPCGKEHTHTYTCHLYGFQTSAGRSPL